jgi:hypothetical protein
MIYYFLFRLKAAENEIEIESMNATIQHNATLN